MTKAYQEALQAVSRMNEDFPPFQISEPVWFRPEHTDHDINCYVVIALTKPMLRGWMAHIVRADAPLAEFVVPVGWLQTECPYKLILIGAGRTTTGISLIAFRGGKNG